MVKFSRELDAQLIPEWRDGFIDYWRLKKLVKKIKVSSKKSPKNKAGDHSVRTWGLGIVLSILQGIRHVAESVACKSRSLRSSDDPAADHNAIQMRRDEYVEEGVVVGSGEANGNGIEEENLFKGGQQEEEEGTREFMEALEEEHLKVNDFYLERESEYMERGHSLLNQLQHLLNHHRSFNRKKGVQRAEKTIRGAFVDLYRALLLLTKFRTLNFLAFVKILKKFDKVRGVIRFPGHQSFVVRLKF